MLMVVKTIRFAPINIRLKKTHIANAHPSAGINVDVFLDNRFSSAQNKSSSPAKMKKPVISTNARTSMVISVFFISSSNGEV